MRVREFLLKVRSFPLNLAVTEPLFVGRMLIVSCVLGETFTSWESDEFGL